MKNIIMLILVSCSLFGEVKSQNNIEDDNNTIVKAYDCLLDIDLEKYEEDYLMYLDYKRSFSLLNKDDIAIFHSIWNKYAYQCKKEI